MKDCNTPETHSGPNYLKSPYPLDQSLGLEFFAANTPGIGGKLRVFIEDFVVSELPKSIPQVVGGDYTHFTLEKANQETIHAAKQLARALGVSLKRFGYAGTKDKRALTTQRVSVWRVAPERLANLKIFGIQLYDFTESNVRLCLGDLEGNAFRILVRETTTREGKLAESLKTTYEMIEANGVPNYYGYQRFGIVRPNTHLVGKKLVEGDVEGAVLNYLGRPYPTESKDAQEARRYLDQTRDYEGALRLYPRRLSYERGMLDALCRNPRDYAAAIHRLPKKLARLLVQAYQAYLFNRILSAIIRAGMEIRDSFVPLIGFRSEFSPREQGEIEKDILEKEGVTPGDFFIRSMPELSSEGTTRRAVVATSPQFAVLADNGYSDRPAVNFEFELPPSCYATIVVREFMKADPSVY